VERGPSALGEGRRDGGTEGRRDGGTEGGGRERSLSGAIQRSFFSFFFFPFRFLFVSSMRGGEIGLRAPSRGECV